MEVKKTAYLIDKDKKTDEMFEKPYQYYMFEDDLIEICKDYGIDEDKIWMSENKYTIEADM